MIIDGSKISDNGDEILELSLIEEKEISQNILDSNQHSTQKKKIYNSKPSKDYVFGEKISEESMKIKDITTDTSIAIIEGEIFQLETRDIRGNRKLVTFNISDHTDSITIKVFLREKQFEEFGINVKEGLYVKVKGDIVYDTYSNYLVLMLNL